MSTNAREPAGSDGSASVVNPGQFVLSGVESGSGVGVGGSVAVGSGRSVAVGEGSGGCGVGVERLLLPARGARSTRIMLTAMITPKTWSVRWVVLAR